MSEDGKVVVKEVQGEKLKVKSEVEFGSQEKPIGITIYDQDTGEAYCTGIKSGEWIKTKGECGAEERLVPSPVSEIAPVTEPETEQNSDATSTSTPS